MLCKFSLDSYNGHLPDIFCYISHSCEMTHVPRPVLEPPPLPMSSYNASGIGDVDLVSVVSQIEPGFICG